MITYIVLKTELIHVGVRQIPTNLFTKKKKKKVNHSDIFDLFSWNHKVQLYVMCFSEKGS